MMADCGLHPAGIVTLGPAIGQIGDDGVNFELFAVIFW